MPAKPTVDQTKRTTTICNADRRQRIEDKEVGVLLWSPSTVSRELRRNTGQLGCRHKQPEGKARERLEAKPKWVKTTPEVVAFMEAPLADGWSTEQINGRMKAEGMPSASHEPIYRHV